MSKLPNHVITKITTVKPEDVGTLDALGRYLTEEEKLEETLNHEATIKGLEERGRDYRPPAPDLNRWIVDFGRIIPEPESIYRGGCDHKHPHPHPDGGFYEHCWYQWNINNWGTKWNAYKATRDEGGVTFQTAWSHPFPVIEALSKKFPEVTFDVRYADEDRGANCGHYTIKDGHPRPADDEPAEGTEEALRFAVELWGQSWEDYQAEMEQYRLEEEEYEAAMVRDSGIETAEVKGEVL